MLVLWNIFVATMENLPKFNYFLREFPSYMLRRLMNPIYFLSILCQFLSDIRRKCLIPEGCELILRNIN